MDRLIALELLRQAAAQHHYASVKLASRQATQVERTIVAIQLYVRDVVRPAPVTDTDVNARYAQIVNVLRALTQRLGTAPGDSVKVSKEMLPVQHGIVAVAVSSVVMPNETRVCERLHIVGCPTVVEGGRRNQLLSMGVNTPDIFLDGLSSTSTSVCIGDRWVGFDTRRSAQTPRSGALMEIIRRQLETERLNEAIGAVVDKLMAHAKISE
jgi:hypothetical protein